MDEVDRYQEFIRQRITELRLQKNVSEHKMSLELGKSGAYIRSITSGASLPSMKELFNICSYFEVTPEEFFRNSSERPSQRELLYKELQTVPDGDLEKVSLFIKWIR